MKKLARPLILLILGALTILLLVRLGDLEISLETLGQLEWRYLSLAIAIHYSGFLVRGLRWRILLAGLGHRLSYIYTTALLMAGWFVSALVPARLGDVARAAMLRRDYHISLAQGFASIATERALDILAILCLAFITALWALPGQTPPWVWQTIGGGALFLIVILTVLLTSPRLEPWLRERFSWPVYQKLVGFGFEFVHSIRQLGQKPGRLLLLTGQSLYIWLCDIFLMYFIILSFGETITLSIAAFTSMIVDLAAAVPIIPGAIGQFEGAGLAILSLFEISPQRSSPIILLNRFISFWTFIIVSGLITYLFGFAQALNSESLGPRGLSGTDKRATSREDTGRGLS